jgi:hypothetical protein
MSIKEKLITLKDDAIVWDENMRLGTDKLDVFIRYMWYSNIALAVVNLLIGAFRPDVWQVVMGAINAGAAYLLYQTRGVK